VIKLATRLRIGEKIGLGFGLVGLIFIAVIWHYVSTQRELLSDYEDLHRIYGARQSYAFKIESRLTAMRAAQERFLRRRDPALAEEVRRQAALLQQQAGELAATDADSRQAAEHLQELAKRFLRRFDAIVEAWQVKGLDEDSGLQGAFRGAAHALEELAGHYNVDRPYLLLLQVRRREKDLGLRRDPRYQAHVHALLDELRATVSASGLSGTTKERLAAEIKTYRTELDAYAEVVLANRDIAGGKGPFRDAAHRIEAILQAHYIPGMKTQILQLRRREKDYLLRGDAEYVAMVAGIAGEIRAQVRESAVSRAEQSRLLTLLANYERDFRALVDQDHRIARLSAEMDAAARQITPLVEENLRHANKLMASMSAEIAAASAKKAQLSLAIAAAALLLGVLFAILLTRRIVTPVRRMAALLDQLTHETPSTRIPTDPKGRDEINAMAISLNTMADHRAGFFNWWRSSMQEAIALRDLHETTDHGERFEAAEELRSAAISKLRQLNAIKGRLRRQAKVVQTTGERLAEQRSGSNLEDGEVLKNVAAEVETLLAVIDDG